MPLALNYIYAGSPTVTNLTYDDKSKTLTCTSTGGPATTVTWRRDGVVITLNTTYQQTTRVVNPVNGTYQTLLTIDPSVGWSDIVGTYSCTVENIRGESSETVVVPGEIWNLVCWHRPTLQCLNYCCIHETLWDELEQGTQSRTICLVHSNRRGIEKLLHMVQLGQKISAAFCLCKLKVRFVFTTFSPSKCSYSSQVSLLAVLAHIACAGN